MRWIERHPDLVLILVLAGGLAFAVIAMVLAP